MAKEALISKLPLPLEQRAGIGVYIGLVTKTNRDAQSSIVNSVRVFKEPKSVYVLGEVANTTPLDALRPVFKAEQRGYREAGTDRIIFDISQEPLNPRRVSTKPILDVNIPVQSPKER